MLANEPGIWTEPVTIHSYDVDWRRQATLEGVCRHFLEAAWNHAEALGAGFTHLAQENRLWVLARLLIKVADYPRWGDQVRLNTWPRAAKSVFAMRDFEMVDRGGNQLLGGSSAWLVLDSTTRKPQRLEKLLARIEHCPERMAIGQDPSKVPVFQATAPEVPTTVARYSDVDVNRHVSSAKYIGWLLDAYGFDFHQAHTAKAIELNYVGETRAEERVRISSHQERPGHWSHCLVKSDGAEVCRARIEWKQQTQA